MRRGAWFVIVAVAVLGVGAAVWRWVPAMGKLKGPVRVGLLHSLTGPMAISEASMVDAEVLALEEINAAGGLLGRRVEWVVADGKSEPATFAREAERLIRDEKVSVLFGCWTSACRKSVKAVVERTNTLLFYPVAYEGMEQSPNIIYTGAAPNQQIIPAIKWTRDALRAKSFFLIGTDSVWTHAVHAIIRDQLGAIGARLAGEAYLGEDPGEVSPALAAAVGAKPDVIISTIEGDSNLPFYHKLRESGEVSARIPVVSFSLSEEELRQLPVKVMTNDYLVCNYFQALERPENRDFVRRFQSRYSSERVTCDSIETAYNSVRFWAQAFRDAESDDITLLRDTVLQQSLDAPEGVISIDRESQHTWRPLFVGRVRNDGQVDVLWSVLKPIRPVPYPFSRSKPEWDLFLEKLRTGWNGNWSPPSVRKPASAD